MEYIIWNPNGPTSPKARFDSRERAEQEAERLAKVHAGARFYVCALVSVSQANKVETTRLDPLHVTLLDAADFSKTIRVSGFEKGRYGL